MKRILVIDDVPERITDIEQEISFSFPGVAIAVQGANTLREARRAFQETKEGFDLVLLDLKLPEDPEVPLKGEEEGGLYVLRHFAPHFPQTIFVLSSGSHSSNQFPTIKLPADFPEQNFHCVPKTAARSELLAILDRMVGFAAAAV